MKLLTNFISNFIHKSNNNSDQKSKFIFYKIVNYIEEDKRYVLQCINTKATFYATISEIVFDIDILYGFHPIQACYIGIEYSKEIKSLSKKEHVKQKQEEKLCKYSICRYGLYKLHSQDREGNVGFYNIKTNKNFLMDPRDIALTEELISEFDAPQAFYIGLLAGFKINSPIKKENNLRKSERPYLYLVK